MNVERLLLSRGVIGPSIPRFRKDSPRKFLEKQARILVEEDYVQPLLNEQGVADFKNVLAPVKQVLEELILPLLQKDKDIMGAGYSFNIRPQQMPVKSQSRPDHFIVFEHMDGIPNGKGYAPPSRPEWSTPADFATQLAARTAWDREYPNGDGPSKRPEYPRLVLYSVDANCNLVILTDYLTTMVLDVKVAGAELIKGEVKKNDDTPHVSFYVLDTPPRLSIFETAINRLHLAKLLKMDGQEGVILMDPKDRQVVE
ncbi:hypothetical protein C8R43DRAFT_955785 [Mycena crocata]|nr:hypothetical protein C8R43DRAFT_955785 [Mycena crocata]